jgi:lipopolysaccharide/colanic/teichoic acid biosynthesis glycosyltransferase
VSRLLKRIADPVLALVGIVCLSPLLLAIAIWILVESGRPLLFVHDRAGKGGKPFPMLKFRTMVKDAVAVAASSASAPTPSASSRTTRASPARAASCARRASTSCRSSATSSSGR